MKLHALFSANFFRISAFALVSSGLLVTHATAESFYLSNTVFEDSGYEGDIFNVVEATYTSSSSTVHGDAYDGIHKVSIAGETVTSLGATFTANSVTSTVQTFAGLSVQQSFRFQNLAGSNYGSVRTFISLTNSSGATIDTTFSLSSDFGSDDLTVINHSSSGDLSLVNNDFWFVSTDGGSDGDPAILSVRYGEGAVLLPAFTEAPGLGYDATIDDISISIADGETFSFLFFSAVGDPFDTADLALYASQFYDLGTLAANGLLDDLTGDQLATVKNFSAVPEPSTYATIAGAGILGFALTRRRRAA